MAATAKQYELLFQLTAQLGPNFSQSFKNASKVMGTLQGDLQNADKKLKDVSAYQKQQNAVAKSKDRVSELQAEHQRLVEEIEATGEATPELTRKLQANEKALQKAKDATANEEEKLQELAKTLKEAGVNTDTLSQDTRELQQEYDRLAQSQKKIQEITEKQSKNNEAIAQTKGQLGGLIGTVTALAGSFFALDEATQEYRANQAKLNTAFQAAGLSADTAQEAYSGFYKILGDNDTATEASQLLAKLARSEEDVSKWTDIAAGVYGTFGDSLPIEALIESANESSRCGQITGNLADAINWAAKEGETFGVTLKANTKANEAWNKAVMEAETAEDYFNLALQSCSTEAERNKLIMDTLQGTYQDATKAFYDNNQQIIQSRQSTMVWNDILAELGSIAGTVRGVLMEMLGVSRDGSVKANSALSILKTTLEKIADNPELIELITKVTLGLVGLKAGGLVAKLGFLHVKGGILSIQKAFTTMKGLGIAKYLKNMTGGFSGILKTVGPLVGIIAAVGGAIYYVSTHLEQVRGFIQKTFGDEGLAVFDKLWGVITQVGTAIKDAFFSSGSGVLDTLKDILPVIIETLQSSLLPLLPMIADLIMQIVPLVGQLITAILPVLGQLISALVPILATLIAEILPVIVSLIQTILPLIMQVIQAILPTLIQLINTLLPILSQIIQAVLPVIIQLIQTLLPIVTQIIEAVLPVLIQLINTLLPIITQIIQAVLPVLIQLINTILPLVMQIIQAILPVFINLLNTIVPIFTQIIQAILPVVIQLIQAILPLVQMITDTILPLFINLLNIIVPIFQTIIQAILPVFQALLSAIIPVVQLLAEVLGAVLGTALQSIVSIVQNVMQIFQGLIDFITGVFTGNWSQAWEGIKSIFSGIVGGLGEIIKAPLRVVVSAVNTVIGGLNKLKIPDWVPGLGGKGINIPLIPGFAKGTNFTPDTFIAGENGPELITGAAGRKVFTAAQTGQIFNNMAQAQNLNTANGVNAKMSGAGTITIQVSNNPTVVIQGGDTESVKAQLAQYDEEFLEKIRLIIVSILKEQREQEGRVAYA